MKKTKPKKLPNPNYKVVRISTPTYLRVQELAKKRETSPPKLLDEMLSIYEALLTVNKGKDIKDGTTEKEIGT